MDALVTFLLIVVVGIAFVYTSKSSIKHNHRVIELLKGQKDKSGRHII